MDRVYYWFERTWTCKMLSMQVSGDQCYTYVLPFLKQFRVSFLKLRSTIDEPKCFLTLSHPTFSVQEQKGRDLCVQRCLAEQILWVISSRGRLKTLQSRKIPNRISLLVLFLFIQTRRFILILFQGMHLFLFNFIGDTE